MNAPPTNALFLSSQRKHTCSLACTTQKLCSCCNLARCASRCVVCWSIRQILCRAQGNPALTCHPGRSQRLLQSPRHNCRSTSTLSITMAFVVTLWRMVKALPVFHKTFLFLVFMQALYVIAQRAEVHTQDNTRMHVKRDHKRHDNSSRAFGRHAGVGITADTSTLDG